MRKDEILATVAPHVPEPIRIALSSEFSDLQSRFVRSDWGPAELNGGRFAEAVFRYMEWKQNGTFTAIGVSLDRTRIAKHISNDSSLPDGIRCHMLKAAELVMDIRNKRDVAHLGNTVSVDEMDAQLVMRLASWCLSEIVREEGKLTGKVAQQIIDRLSSRSIPLVEEIAGDLIVVATHLDASDKAMVALYSKYPSPLGLEDLRLSVQYQHASRFRALMQEKMKQGLVHIKGSEIYLTKKGLAWVEANIDLTLIL